MKACIDIGGTKVAVTLARDDARLKPVERLLSATRCTEPTATRGTPLALAEQVLRLLAAAQAQARLLGYVPDPITAVGVSSCGPFVLEGGAVALVTPNICGGVAGPSRGLPNDWTSVPLEAPLRAALQAQLPAGHEVHLRVENDGVAALEAERQWGALQSFDHCGYVTWSTGIGAGLCVDGKVLRGKNGNAGHAGHIFVSDEFANSANPLLCGCGNVGDLEALVAGNALQRRFGADTATLMTAARQGEPAAVAIVDEACRVMGRALYNLVTLLDLERISLGGSVFLHHQDWLLPRLQAQVAGKMRPLTDGFRLVSAGLGHQVGDFAALAMAG
jgi:glucokinase